MTMKEKEAKKKKKKKLDDNDGHLMNSGARCWLNIFHCLKLQLHGSSQIADLI